MCRVLLVPPFVFVSLFRVLLCVTRGMFLVFIPCVFSDLYFAFVANLSFFVLLSSQFVVFLDSWVLCIVWLPFNKARLLFLHPAFSVFAAVASCAASCRIVTYHDSAPETESTKQNKQNRI